ncbi:MAG: hypothetical protein ABEJ23_04325 [Haloarculaceae archaeon]
MAALRVRSVLVVLVVLAGCQGIAGRGGETPTLTPVPVPTMSPTDRPPQTLAPGMTDAGVTDPDALAAAHAAALAGTPVTYHATYTERTAGGRLRSRTVTAIRYGRGDRYDYRRTDVEPGRPDRHVDRWSTGERVLERQVVGANTTYRVLRGSDGDPLAPGVALPVDRSRSGGIERVFRAVDTQVVGRTVENGTTYYRVQSTGMTTPNPTAVRNASLVARVDATGVVHRYRLTYTIDRGADAGRVQVTGTVRFTDIGTTTIERPAWTGRVENE